MNNPLLPHTITVIPSQGCPSITGLSSVYSEAFPNELSSYLAPSLFTNSIRQFNDILSVFWPCFCARLFSYMCCPCSLGFSLLIPYECLKDAEQALQREIDRVNSEVFEDKGLKIVLKKGFCRSWLEVQRLFHGEIEVFAEKNENF